MLSMFLRFASAGAIGTLGHYSLLIVLVSILGVAPSTSAACGATVGALINYWLTRTYVFYSTKNHRKTLPRFFAMAFFGILFNGFLVGSLTSAGMHYLAAQIIATIIVLFINFGVSKIWIFH